MFYKHVFHSAASIWFEIWGFVDPRKKIRFSRQISRKFGFFQAISQKISIFQANFRKVSIFSQYFTKNFDFLTKIGHLKLLLGKLFLFSSKVTTAEHTSCT